MMRPKVLLVTDPAFGDDMIVRCVRAAARALPSGALGVQLRDKHRSAVSLRVFAGYLRAVTRSVGALLFVNGDPRIARDIGADGVHLDGASPGVGLARDAFGRPTWVSMAAHTDDDVRRASREGADAVLVSPVFTTRPPTAAGPAKVARGLGALSSARACARADLAIYALGGVGPDTAHACAMAGADGVAVMGALLGARGRASPDRAARAIHDALTRR
jgi:thiamine-phosphate diphosphorylase